MQRFAIAHGAITRQLCDPLEMKMKSLRISIEEHHVYLCTCLIRIETLTKDRRWEEGNDDRLIVEKCGEISTLTHSLQLIRPRKAIGNILRTLRKFIVDAIETNKDRLLWRVYVHSSTGFLFLQRKPKVKDCSRHYFHAPETLLRQQQQ